MPTTPSRTKAKPTTNRKPALTPQSPFPFETVTQQKLVQRVTGFIYGASGAGKTFMIRSAVENPDMYPVLVCSCDSGELTLKDLIDNEKLVVAQTGLDDLSRILSFVSGPKNTFKTIVIDNLTELHRRALMTRSTMRVESGKAASIGELTMQDYGIARTQLLSVVSNYALNLKGINVFFTALSHTVVDELSGAVSYEPDLAGRLSGEVPGYCDVVGFLTVKTPSASDLRKAERAGKTLRSTRVLVTNQTRQVPIARNRGGKLGDEMVNPTLPKIRSLLLAT